MHHNRQMPVHVRRTVAAAMWSSFKFFSSARVHIKKYASTVRQHKRSLTKVERAKQRLRRQRYFQIAGTFVGAYVLWRVFDKIQEFVEHKETTISETEGGAKKPKLLVLGTGFGALGFLDDLNTKNFDVSVVSPRGYFLFTPELASGTVGTVEIESLVEPIRSRDNLSKFQYFEATAEDIDVASHSVHCRPVKSNLASDFKLDYDYLIVAVGGHNATHNIPGVQEHARFLKSLEDARKLRTNMIDAFEVASLPGVSEELKKRLLHFVVVGGSPAAREVAAQLHDFVTETAKQMHPELAEFAKVSLVPVNDHIHNYYDHVISSYVAVHSKRHGIEVLKDAKVVKIDDKVISIQNADGAVEQKPYGTCVWATGLTLHPLAKKIAQKFPEQNNELGLVVNRSLRLEGAKNIYAVGDCSTISTRGLTQKFEKLVEDSDVNKDGVIDKEEFAAMCQKLGQKYPALLELRSRADEIFAMADVDHDNNLGMSEFKHILEELDKNLTRFPTSASTAVQQGNFLAKHFNKGEYLNESTEHVFRYKHFGGYEYIGAEDGLVKRGSKGGFIFSGPGAWWLWANVYFSSVVRLSMKARITTSKFWSKIFGREVTRY